MNFSDGLMSLWQSTGIYNMIEKADPTITNAVEQFFTSIRTPDYVSNLFVLAMAWN